MRSPRCGTAIRSPFRCPKAWFTADACARTFRTRVATIAPAAGDVKTDQGLRIVVDAAQRVAADVTVDVPQTRPTQALDTALAGIAQRYGAPTADMVRLQLEYPSAQR